MTTAPAVSSPPLLEVANLRVTFSTSRGPLTAVDGVTLSVAEGTTLGIVGESGSGKSVLARTVMGLSQKRGAQVEGIAKIAGRSATGRDVRGREVAMVFQDPMTSLNPVRRIGVQVTESMVAHLGLSRAEAKARAITLLGEVGLPSPERRMRSYPHELSGGMRQRVVIAIALACSPRLLIADEPTTALDVTVQAQILDLLQREQTDRNMGMILITHDFGVAANRTDDIIVMYAGQIVERAPTALLMQQPMMPYTIALMRSIPRLDRPPHERLEVVGGQPPNLAQPPEGCRFAPRCPKADDKCRAVAPPLTELIELGRAYRCWYPELGKGTPNTIEPVKVTVSHGR